MLANNEHRVKDVGSGAGSRRAVATLDRSRAAIGTGPGEDGEDMGARLLRRGVRLVLGAAVATAAARIGRAVLERRGGRDPGSTPRAGSFDSWPPVPPAPDPTTG